MHEQVSIPQPHRLCSRKCLIFFVKTSIRRVFERRSNMHHPAVHHGSARQLMSQRYRYASGINLIASFDYKSNFVLLQLTINIWLIGFPAGLHHVSSCCRVLLHLIEVFWPGAGW